MRRSEPYRNSDHALSNLDYSKSKCKRSCRLKMSSQRIASSISQDPLVSPLCDRPVDGDRCIGHPWPTLVLLAARQNIKSLVQRSKLFPLKPLLVEDFKLAVV